jgi:hypothetical protein
VRVGFSRRVDAASRRATGADMRSHRKIRIVFFMRELLSERGEREGKYGDVVVLAELLCGFGDGAGGLGANGLGSVEAEELATFVSGFYDSVRYEGEAVVWIELECGFGVIDIRGDAKRQAGFNIQLLPIAVGREVSGVGEGHVAGGGDKRGCAGNEACYLAVENAVEVSEDFGGFSHRAAAQRADDGADGHGSFEALAADVSDNNEQRAIVGGHDLEEVTAYFTGGKIDAFDGKTGGDGRLCGDE